MYVKHHAVPLLHLDVIPDSLPPCPVDEQDEHVSVITNDPNRFCTASCGLQHIATQRDVRLLMGDETVKFVNELHVILRGISTQDAGEETFVLGILQDCFSVWEWCAGRQMEVFRSCPGSPHPLVVLRSWLIIIIAVKQHQFWGFWRVTAQSNTEARGKIACCPSNRLHNMYNIWLASTSTTSGAGALLTGTPIHLTSTVLSAFLKHPNSSMRDGGTGLSSY